LKGRIYISSQKPGLEVYADLTLTTLLQRIDSFRGPVNLSHPSCSLIGINHKEEKIPFGVFADFGWVTLDMPWEPNSDAQYPKAWRLVSRLLMLIHKRQENGGLYRLPKEVVYLILRFAAPSLEQLKMIERPLLWSNEMKWLTMDLGETLSLRRSWYGGGLLMVYMVDARSHLYPEDGVRALWINRQQGYIDHTLISCPFKPGTLFCLEIPHGKVGEVVFVAPLGMVVSGTDIIVLFPLRTSSSEAPSKYNWCMSTSDSEGSSAERQHYCCAYEEESAGKKTWCVVLSQALH